MTPPLFGKAIPVLASLDLPRTLAFYQTALGFEVHHFAEAGYGIAQRDGTELHFWTCADRHIAENTSCYLRVADIRAVHAELSQRIPSLGEVVQTDWGMDELYVIDPDGNLLKFGQERHAR
ncbi:bleomycin resistance protein [Herbaspirillum sp. alder98]|uniref:bleomycin resistance protein n=1 Tax=Herbaspirillum sp. alder98 TaxID=2913096 RepID=UPI001CD90AEE|nr:VOC family protein [Herbaspirillum sp. alder98]MCA1323057.1 VOC family protein [Herbaspirillum sp. alder98]